MKDQNFSKATQVLYSGKTVRGRDYEKPAAFPLFTNTAYFTTSLTEARASYLPDKFGYVRANSPNRESLAETVSFLENGEKSLIFSSGMGAITTTLLNILKSGDHVLCNSSIYGEAFEVIGEFLEKFGVEHDFVNFNDLEAIRQAMKPNTKIVYTEVLANPNLDVADIPAVAEIAHAGGALLMVDNTFTTGLAIRPLELGADIVANSLTKFMNGHSNAISGSVTASAEIMDSIFWTRMLCGTSGDPFAAWTIASNIQTIDLRVGKQMANAAKLAAALEAHPHVSKVNHPSLESFPQHELAMRLFASKETMCGMLSFIVPEDMEKIDQFLEHLHLAHYATTLGGIHTTLSHPVTSSHRSVPDDVRRKMGITPGMFRLSVGIEDAEDLIADFYQALEVFDN